MLRKLLPLVALMLTYTSVYAQEPKPVLRPATERNIAAERLGLEGRILYMDAAANLRRLSTRDGVADAMNRTSGANFNVAVVDVKPLAGFVFYHSDIAPRIQTWRGVDYPRDHDLLAVAVEEGRRRGIEVHAGINVFSEGQVGTVGSAGMADLRPDWQAIAQRLSRWVMTPNDAYPVAAVDSPALPGRLAIYFPSDEPVVVGERTRQILASNDTVMQVFTPGELPDGYKVPTESFLVSATGVAGSWLAHLEPGMRLDLEARPQLVRVGLLPDEHRAIFTNPANPVVQAYEIAVAKEIVSNYAVDGLALDRMRWSGLTTDFSVTGRRLFESWLGRSVARWPQDIYEFSPWPGEPIIEGPLYRQWLEWRAAVIKDFLIRLRAEVKAVRPDLILGSYVGSWYDTYYTLGVNWGSPKYRANLPWMTKTYHRTGYAHLVDYLMVGTYYRSPTIEDALEAGIDPARSVEGAALGSLEAVQDATWTYASIYVLDYARDPDTFQRAIDVCTTVTQGCMVFDMVYLYDYDWWHISAETFPTPAPTPHGLQKHFSHSNTNRKVSF